jgi:hypothetical protein
MDHRVDGNPRPPYAHLLPTRWKPGISPNPLGQHYGLLEIAKRLRRESKNGREVVEFLMETLRDPTAGRRIRLQAAEVILAYAYGRPREVIELQEGGGASDALAVVRRLSREDRDALATILSRALEPSPAPVETVAEPVRADEDKHANAEDVAPESPSA